MANNAGEFSGKIDHGFVAMLAIFITGKGIAELTIEKNRLDLVKK